MTKKINNMEKGLEYLETLSEEELADWMRRFLAENLSYPLSILSKNTYRNTILLQYYFMSTDSGFRRRFERAILDLVNSWRASADPSWQEPADSLDYFAEILAIAGRIRISGTYSRLLVLAKSEKLKKKTGLGVDLHYLLLRVLFGFAMDENRQDLEYIIDRDIEDPRYVALCFRRSWELEYQNGIENLPILLKCYLENPIIDVEGALDRFMRKLGQKGLKREFLVILQKLEDPYYVHFCDIMKNIGIEPFLTDFEESDKIRLAWREKDEISSILIKIPERLNEKLKKAKEAMYLWMSKQYELADFSNIVPQPAPAPEVKP